MSVATGTVPHWGSTFSGCFEQISLLVDCHIIVTYVLRSIIDLLVRRLTAVEWNYFFLCFLVFSCDLFIIFLLAYLSSSMQ